MRLAWLICLRLGLWQEASSGSFWRKTQMKYKLCACSDLRGSETETRSPLKSISSSLTKKKINYKKSDKKLVIEWKARRHKKKWQKQQPRRRTTKKKLGEVEISGTGFGFLISVCFWRQIFKKCNRQLLFCRLPPVVWELLADSEFVFYLHFQSVKRRVLATITRRLLQFRLALVTFLFL